MCVLQCFFKQSFNLKKMFCSLVTSSFSFGKQLSPFLLVGTLAPAISSILFSYVFVVKQKKTDHKGVLSDGSCFSVERRVIFLLRNVKCKESVSCPVVETTHLRLICIRRMKSRSSSTRKKQEKAIIKFSPHVFESPTFKGSNDSQ